MTNLEPGMGHEKQTQLEPSVAVNEAASTQALAAAEAAVRRIAPVWPLQNFVAVNPFLGLVDRSFAQAGRLLRALGSQITMPRSYYASALKEGRVTDRDLIASLDAAENPSYGLDQLKAEAHSEHCQNANLQQPAPTLAALISCRTGHDWASFLEQRTAQFAADYFDQGQAAWPRVDQSLPLYACWRDVARMDRSPAVMGLAGFRDAIDGLPQDAEKIIGVHFAQLGLAAERFTDYCHRVLLANGGWAAYARYRLWQRELYGKSDSALIELLAVQLASEMALFRVMGKADDIAELRARWQAAYEPSDDVFATDLLLQSALERGWQRRLLTKLRENPAQGSKQRPVVQAAFCIDVRSEVFRRALESVAPEVETIGFAGFFGFPMEYIQLGNRQGSAQCPVLLTPQFTVRERVLGASEDEETEILGLRLMRRKASKAWKSFKMAAVSCFGFVETMGWTYAGKLLGDGFGWTRPVPHPRTEGIDRDVEDRLGPSIARSESDGRVAGFSSDQRIDMAEAVLKAMSMRGGFARLVLLAGHGSTSLNNPHASGLDCGACGGHTGEANARVAAMILNDPAVRTGLRERGIEIPEDTFFVAALHDTTTDEVALFEEEYFPESHRDDLAQLCGWLEGAGARSRAERAPALQISEQENIDARVVECSRDWSQVRPEWGLAGCAAFIAAPRWRTRNVDLEGRSFLHSYDWREDEDFATLELILTAPVVVASWISLQYYGSTVDNQKFGSGNKTLHNVVGTLGVLEGNAGDLRVGLPWQSVHDGEKFVHEPLRLTVIIEAPTRAIDEILAKHRGVRELFDNGWLHLFNMESDTEPAFRRYAGDFRWTDA